MALTEFQRHVCRLIASERKRLGESYVAGGAALNTALGASRISRDIDLFHDRTEAVTTAFEADSGLLRAAAFDIEVRRRHEGFAEAIVRKGTDVAELPPERAGTCVLASSGELFSGDLEELRKAVADQTLRYHEGRLRGALPTVGE